MEEERKSGVLIDIGHPGPLFLGKAIVDGLEESADLVLICFSPGKDYDRFAKVEGRAGC